MIAPAPGGPPRVAFHCAVGITGHRPDIVGDAGAALPGRLAAVLAAIADAARAVAAREARWFAPGDPMLHLVSPLAAGADQVAADVALESGYALEAVLPFGRDDYAADFDADQVAAYRATLDRAAAVLELPGDRARSLDAYLMAGRATVAQSDLMIAVWDGLPARGRGGTGEVVELALRRGRPVIHLSLDPDAPVRVLWAGFDPHASPARITAVASRPFDADALVAALLAPPFQPAERHDLSTFHAEREHRLRPRLEYPLLLAFAGVRRMRRSAWAAAPYLEATRAEWASFHAGSAPDRLGVAADLGALEHAYCWADRLAQHYAQSYRSGHVLNFVLGAGAVLLALGGLLTPGIKLWLAIAELALIGAVIVNTHLGSRGEWHRRWLDYRQLAERLRPMRSLKLLGIAEPAVGEGGRRWVDWYAAAAWRATRTPRGRLEAGRTSAMARFLAAEELHGQIAYHRESAAHLHRLDHRLHRIGNALFAVTIAACLVFIIGYFTHRDWVTAHAPAFVFLSAGLPALGTALFGIRVQGEFGGAAERSLLTAERLGGPAAALNGEDPDLPRCADLLEGAARTMLADLGEWRMTYGRRKLVIPG